MKLTPLPNQYASILPSAGTPAYDADGNMISNGTWTYTWDAENRLVEVRSNGETLVKNAYDFMGRRIWKSAAAMTNRFLYDGWNPIAEIQSSTNFYLWGLDLSGTLQAAGGVGGLLAILSPDSSPLMPVYDANGNVTALVGTNGSVAARYEYDPYGNLLAQSGEQAGANPFRFSTKYWDDETSLYYYGYRFYSPQLGRWTNRDSQEEKGGINLYSFCDNDSLNFVDYDGQRKGPPFRRKNKRKEWQTDVSLLTGLRGLLGGLGSIIDLDAFRSRGFFSLDSGSSQHCQFVFTINGIWNSRADSQALLDLWRKDFPDTLGTIPNAGYVHNPTMFITDLIQIGFLELGAIGIPSHTTAEYIQRAYYQAKKDCCKCTDIYIIAHSQGAAVLNQAMPLLSAEVKRSLRILTIGAEQYIRGANPEFGYVINVNSEGDIVPDLSPRNRFYHEIQVSGDEVPGHPHANYREYFQRVGLPPGYIVPVDRQECK